VLIMRTASDESGASLVLVLLLLPVLVLLSALVLDTANWFVHQRHLQTQADAAALAAARDFQFPCGGSTTMPPDAQIIATAHQYDGTGSGAFNEQVGSPAPIAATTYNSTAHNIFSVINGANYVNQSRPDDTDLTGDPCADKAIDVKMTETNVPSFFNLAGLSFMDLIGAGYLNAQARVSLKQLASSAGAAPIAIQSSTPNSVHANFIDEAKSGAPSLGGAELTSGDQGQTWTNSSPISISFNGAGSRVGVRVGLSGGNAAGSTCSGSGPTFCFDSTAPNNGLWMIHTWARQAPTSDNLTSTVGVPTGAGKTPFGPLVKDVWLAPSSGIDACANTTFTALAASCTVVLHANLEFKAGDQCTAVSSSPVSVKLTVTSPNNNVATSNLACPAGGSATGAWTSSAITIPAGSTAASTGPTSFRLDYTLQSGEQKPGGATGGTTANPSLCTTQNNRSCSNDGVQNGFGEVVQRIFAGAPDLSSADVSRSSSISDVSITDHDTGAPVTNDSIQRCSGTETCTRKFDVTVSIFSLASTNDISLPAINLRSADPQGNGAIDCGQGNGASHYATALVNGCPRVLAKAPSGSTNAVCAGAPDECVSTVPGNGKVTDALDGRIACRSSCSNGDGSVGQASVPSTKCDNPNFWTSPNNLSSMKSRIPADPRLVQLIIVPFGSLTPNGSYSVPIRDFASFYITGYDSNGSQKTCKDAGTYASAGSGSFSFVKDTAAANHEIWGHFVVFTDPSAGGTPGTGSCDPDAASDCIAVLTK
jgi:hypothetical protein